MVFCGKASLSCKNCRIRRIKCNKLQPECSQCTRAGKKCPGYRDQLSLMFRDETVKVRSKFQEVPPGSGPAAASTSASTPATSNSGSNALADTPEASSSGTWGRWPRSTSRSGSNQDDGPFVKEEDGDDRKDERDIAWIVETDRESRRSRLSQTPDNLVLVSGRKPYALAAGPQTTMAERGLHFYIGSYIYGQTHEPSDSALLAVQYPWLFQPATTPLVSAVGLVAMANLTGDKELRDVSRQHYLSGLQKTNQSLMSARLQDMETTIRGIVLMAMFEVVRGDSESFDIASVHVKGAAALMRNFLPLLPPASQPFRSLMQYCFSMLIPCYATGACVPPIVLDYVTAGSRNVPADERAITELLVVAAAFINLAAHVRRHVIADGMASTTALLAKTRELDARLAAWERYVLTSKQWRFDMCHTTVLPPDACFGGRFHHYADIPTARMWSYYRWVRILNSELLLDVAEKCPQSAEVAMRVAVGTERPGASGSSDGPDDEQPSTFGWLRAHLLRVIRRMAEDTLVSTPTFWRHPRVPREVYDAVTAPTTLPPRKAGAGAVGMPPLLFHLQAAGCGRGVPEAQWRWALAVVDMVWAKLGMQQARKIADAMRASRRGWQGMAKKEGQWNTVSPVGS